MAVNTYTRSSGEIFDTLKKYYEYLLNTNDDEVYEVTRRRYADMAWINDKGRVTRERIDRFIVSNLNGKDVMMIYKENAGMPFEESSTLFYYKNELIYVRKDGIINVGERRENGDIFYHFQGCEEEGLSKIRRDFTSTASKGRLKNVSKAAIMHICNFLHISKEEAEQYYEMNRKKRRVSKWLKKSL